MALRFESAAHHKGRISRPHFNRFINNNNKRSTCVSLSNESARKTGWEWWMVAFVRAVCGGVSTNLIWFLFNKSLGITNCADRMDPINTSHVQQSNKLRSTNKHKHNKIGTTQVATPGSCGGDATRSTANYKRKTKLYFPAFRHTYICIAHNSSFFTNQTLESNESLEACAAALRDDGSTSEIAIIESWVRRRRHRDGLAKPFWKWI